ncbi:dihydroxyacetone kinase, L subunit [Coriobacterium glomerans PW2]|uniref:Dihydroxyacetone kinase, L subunit n=1 Tax=Coriobacterium glomerans (strain ATCC 49209 / DSM 20642 / JCM 10262 / PW2) TaxID=700015 RepID=F2N7D3_CORGP|nr:dihydroxyacetone kinase subunit DhaL [Coriobacterium glomerans]AEB06608.1 dihydroxyacetone kinase, L subunit [Coriobacterium glomerans PW2]
MNVNQFSDVLRCMNTVIAEHKDELSELDAAIGDGDHGANMARGFSLIVQDLDDKEYAGIGELLSAEGMVLLSNVGGASGPLYGTLLIQMGAPLKGCADADGALLADAFHAGVLAVHNLGKAEIGDKTMYDVLAPVDDLLAGWRGEGEGRHASAAEVIALAEEKCESTRDMLAKKGRASYLKERSIGHLDPGARSCSLLIEVMCQQLEKKEAAHA